MARLGYTEFKASLGYIIPCFEGGCEAKKTNKGSNERVEILMSTLGLAFPGSKLEKGRSRRPYSPTPGHPQRFPKSGPHLPPLVFFSLSPPTHAPMHEGLPVCVASFTPP